MSLWRIIGRNLIFFRRQNMGVFLSATLCGVVLTGALTVGDSISSRLREMASKRIGKADLALLSPDGFFEEDLAERIASKLPDGGALVAPMVVTRGTLSTPDGSVKVTKVQVLGVDERFWSLAPDPSSSPMGGEWAKEGGASRRVEEVFFANQRLAERLRVDLGERLILRMEEPSLFSRDAPLSGERDNKFVTLNQPFKGIISAEGFGSFGLQGNQKEPLSIFVPLKTLQRKLFRSLDEASGNTGYANFLLMGMPAEGELKSKDGQAALDESWTLADAGIEIRELRDSKQWSVRTRQVFLSDGLADKARSLSPASAGVLTYLVNSLERRNDENQSLLIPYSMMTAVEPDKVDFLERDWADHQIALNEWAAKDLNASLSDRIKVGFYTVGERRRLIESSKIFELRKILPMPSVVPEDQESDWTPRFPGLSDAESCGEWDTGIPIVHEVRDRDEDYWNKYRGSPKAFVSLKAGREMWGNRWGSLTGLRIGKEELTQEDLESELRKILRSEDAGLVLNELRSDAAASVESPVDFRQLFLGFSLFIMIAVLSITGMTFAFSIEQRNKQMGILGAVGWKIGRIRQVFWLEGSIVAGLGSLLGVLLASLYGKVILGLLSRQWEGAVTGADFSYEASAGSLLLGGLGTALICVASMTWATRRQIKREPRALLSSGADGFDAEKSSSKGRAKYILPAMLCLLLSLALGWKVGFSSKHSSIVFFGAGSLLLLSGLFWFRAKLLFGAEAVHGTSLKAITRKNLGRRAGRSLVTVGAMAVGSFLVVGTGAFRKEAPQSPESFKSGTGGFVFWGESAAPIYEDLHDKEAIHLFDLNETLLGKAKVVPMRIREGDDASCLNLNKALRPRIYGVNPAEFEGRFEFAEGNWSLLLRELEGGSVPALVDQNTLMWALKMGLGDRIEFLDGDGKPFQVSLIGALKDSILQGALFIDESRFVEKFKRQGGYQAFALSGELEAGRLLAAHLEDRFYRHGLEFRESSQRLVALQRVQNTYLSIFQGLGGLGMLVGTLGLGLVVVRNQFERSQETALLEAIGYRLRQMRRQSFDEHAQLAFWGLLIGSSAAFMGIAPAIFGNMTQKPSSGFLWFFIAFAGLAFFWIWMAVKLTLKKTQLSLLRHE